MKKIFTSLLSVFVLLFALVIQSFIFANPANADSGTCKATPSQISDTQNLSTVQVYSPDLEEGSYRLWNYSASWHAGITDWDQPYVYNSPFTTVSLDKKGYGNLPGDNPGKAGSYTFQLVGKVNYYYTYCTFKLNIVETRKQQCSIQIISKPIDPSTDIEFSVSNINPGSYDIYVDNTKYTYNIASGTPTKLSHYAIGQHSMEIRSVNINNKGELQCTPAHFQVAPRGSGGGGSIEANTGDPNKGSDLSGVRCIANNSAGINTAIGCIPIDTQNNFVGWWLGWAIGAAGGIALLLIMFAGFNIMTASGDPQKLNNGRELLTAAVSGLILIIFSVFLLRLIGVSILNLPGLT